MTTSTTITIEDTGDGFYLWDTTGRSLGPVSAARALADRLWGPGAWSIAELRKLVEAAETDYQFEGQIAVRFSNEAFA